VLRPPLQFLLPQAHLRRELTSTTRIALQREPLVLHPYMSASLAIELHSMETKTALRVNDVRRASDSHRH
jgi:hypothetical protein